MRRDSPRLLCARALAATVFAPSPRPTPTLRHQVNESTDKRLAEHIVQLYQLDRTPAHAVVPQRTLMDYISYARREVHPKISDEAAQELIRAYLAMRNMSGNLINPSCS